FEEAQLFELIENLSGKTSKNATGKNPYLKSFTIAQRKEIMASILELLCCYYLTMGDNRRKGGRANNFFNKPTTKKILGFYINLCQRGNGNEIPTFQSSKENPVRDYQIFKYIGETHFDKKNYRTSFYFLKEAFRAQVSSGLQIEIDLQFLY